MLVFLGFDQVFIVTRSFGLRLKMCRPTAGPEAPRRKRRTRDKNLWYPWQLETEKIRFASNCDVI